MRNSVLIVEDDEIIRENIKEYLEINGFHVFETENAKTGLSIAQDNSPDVIVSDVMMPGMNGIEMISELKKNTNTSLIPIILITAKVESKDVREGMTVGADDYITKPFDLQDLLHSVNTQIAKKNKIHDHIHLEYTKSFEHWKNIANHELFTPINVIQNVYHLISNQSKLDDELDSIFKLSVTRLKRTISNLLLLSGVFQIENNFKYTSFVEFQNHIDSIIIDILENEVKKDKFQIQYTLPEHFFMKDYFFLIIKEIMDNAYKFSKPETQVTIEVSIVNDQFIFKSINQNKIDNTMPINNNRAFTQVARDSYEQQGLGLGLYIINRISSMFNDIFSIEQNKDAVECTWKSKIKFL